MSFSTQKTLHIRKQTKNNNTFAMNEQEEKLDFSPKVSGEIIDLSALMDDTSSEQVAAQAAEELEEVVIPESIVEEIATEEEEIELPLETKPEVEEEVSIKQPTGTDYKAIINKMVEKNVWQGFDTIEQDGVEVSLEDAEITEEMFDSIAEAQAAMKQELDSSKIDTDSVSEFTKKLVEIESNGGSVRDALNAYQSVKEPLEQLDTSTDDGKKAVIYMQLKAKGQTDGDIRKLIRVIEQDGELEERAEVAETELNAAYNDYLDQVNQSAIAQREAEKEAQKEYRKKMSVNLDTSFKLKDSIKKKLVDISTSKTESGLSQLDEIYNEVKKDPSRAHELALFLFDKKEYISQVSNKKVTDDKLETMKKISLTSRGTGSLNVNRKDDKNVEGEVDIENVFKT